MEGLIWGGSIIKGCRVRTSYVCKYVSTYERTNVRTSIRVRTYTRSKSNQNRTRTHVRSSVPMYVFSFFLVHHRLPISRGSFKDLWYVKYPQIHPAWFHESCTMSNTETPYFSPREAFASIPFLKPVKGIKGKQFFGEFYQLNTWWVSDERFLDEHLQCQICKRGEKEKYKWPLWRCKWCNGAFCPHHITKVVSMRNAPLGWCVECYRRGQIIQKAHQEDDARKRKRIEDERDMRKKNRQADADATLLNTKRDAGAEKIQRRTQCSRGCAGVPKETFQSAPWHKHHHVRGCI